MHDCHAIDAVEPEVVDLGALRLRGIEAPPEADFEHVRDDRRRSPLSFRAEGDATPEAGRRRGRGSLRRYRNIESFKGDWTALSRAGRTFEQNKNFFLSSGLSPCYLALYQPLIAALEI
jgi:hypothetical protein